MKWLALLGLLLVQDPDVDGLLKQLTDESIEVREKAAAALIDLGEKAEEKIKARLGTAEGDLKKACETILDRIARNRKLRAVVPKLRRVTIEAKDKPVHEVLATLKEQTELPLDTSAAGEARVTVSIKDALPLQALDAICRTADLDYLPDPYEGRRGPVEGVPAAAPPLKIRAGHSKSPRAFSGHFLVEVESIQLTRSIRFRNDFGSSPDGELSLRLHWNPAVRPTRVADFAVKSVQDDKGNDLKYDTDEVVIRHMGRDMETGLDIQLKRPGDGATSIGSAKGRLSILLALGRTTLAFENPQEGKGQVREFDGITIKLLECSQEGDELRVKLATSGKRKTLTPKEAEDPFDRGASLDYDSIQIKTEDGRPPRGGRSYTGSGDGKGGMTYSISYQRMTSKVKSIELSMDTEYHEELVEFELKDIPLPK